jgi:hypothetical protein
MHRETSPGHMRALPARADHLIDHRTVDLKRERARAQAERRSTLSSTPSGCKAWRPSRHRRHGGSHRRSRRHCRRKCVAESTRSASLCASSVGPVDRASLYLGFVPHLSRAIRLQSLIFLGCLRFYEPWCQERNRIKTLTRYKKTTMLFRKIFLPTKIPTDDYRNRLARALKLVDVCQRPSN